jgi:toxin ParE1/3/4
MNSRSRRTLAPDADKDIDAILEWLIENADEATALRFLDRAEQAFRLLARNPTIGRERGFRGRRLKGLRSWRVPGFASWLVFYKVTRAGVLVLRVLHGSRDLERIFET